ncbi:hypothetical protein GCM10010344_50500 [Streptomyces bluensis]|nr:hypothetical protein GCM10010344_50500 [Streptomyces bluensis]
MSQRLKEVSAEPTRLLAGAARVGHPIAVLPVLFHLLWTSVLAVDLRGDVLNGGTVVRTGTEAL